jgi:hypothetical protein
MSYFNAASDIIDAFMKGAELRRQRELLELQKQQLEIQRKQAEAAERRAAAYEEAQQQAIKTAEAKNRKDVINMIAQGLINVPKKPAETLPPFFAPRAGIVLPPTVTKETLAEPYDFGGLLEKPITPEEVVLPTEYAKTVEQLARAKAAPTLEFKREELGAKKEMFEEKLALDRLIHDDRINTVREALATKNYMNERQIEARMKIAEMQIAARMALGKNSQNTRASEFVDRVVKDVNNSLIGKNFQAATAAYYYAQSIKDPKNMTGAEDISLLYNWIRAQDSTAVREGELRLAQEAIPWLQRAGIKFRRVADGIILSPEARQQIINDIKRQYNLKFNAMVPLIKAAYARAKAVHPNLTQDQFKTLFVHNFIMGDPTIPADKINFNDIDLEAPNNMTPGVLVPRNK